MVAIGDKIVLSFGWKGPNTWKGGWSCGGLSILVIDLMFKGAKSETSVHFSGSISPAHVQKFEFTFLRRPYSQETHPRSILVTAEQIRNLTLKAGFFEKGDPIGPKVMDLSTGKVTQQETARRKDREVPLVVPEELDEGAHYLLQITADENLSLSACLVQES